HEVRESRLTRDRSGRRATTVSRLGGALRRVALARKGHLVREPHSSRAGASDQAPTTSHTEARLPLLRESASSFRLDPPGTATPASVPRRRGSAAGRSARTNREDYVKDARSAYSRAIIEGVEENTPR